MQLVPEAALRSRLLSAKIGLTEPCLILCPFEASISLGEPGRIQGLKSYTGLDRVFDRL